MGLAIPSLLVAGLVLLPLVYLVLRASEGSFSLDESALLLILRSVGLAVSCALIAALLSTVLAALTTLTDVPGRRALHILAVAPLSIPSYVAASAWLAALTPLGPLGRLGLAQPRGFFWAVLVVTGSTFPLAYLPIRAAMSRAPAAPFEAARTLGRGPFVAFVHGVLPGLRPAIASGAGLVALYALSEFGAVSLLGYNAFPRVIYQQYNGAFDRTQAAVNSLILAALVGLFLVVIERASRAVAKDPPRGRPLHIALGRWKALALAPFALVFFATLFVPLAALANWLIKLKTDDLAWLWPSLQTSLVVGAISAALSVALALAPSILVERSPRAWTRVLARVLDYGFALPGIVVALGLGFFALNVVTPLYQSWPMLVVAYVTLFVALAIAPLRAVLSRLPTAYEEAARTLGKAPLEAFMKVTAPLLWPALLAGALVVWLTAMKELPATLLLIPAGEATLATRLWSFTDEALFSESAVAASVLIGISVVIVFGISRRQA